MVTPETKPSFSSARPPDFYDTYHSVFEYRYGSPEMRAIWSERNRWSKARQIWVAAAEVQNQVGKVTDEELADLKANIDNLDVQRIFDLEKVSGHDVAASIAEFSEKAPIGGRILHQGMTSEDPLANVEMLRIHEAIELVDDKLSSTLLSFADQIEKTNEIVCMGWTHLQAAEPTTVGYRLARYAQDLLTDKCLLDFIKEQVKGKGIKGAVGTSASFTHLLEKTGMTAKEHEEAIMRKLGIPAVLISGQTYPRKFDLLTVMALASIGQSLHHFTLDLQVLQSSPFAEWAEPRRKKQIGSSAMPHKQNPINSENVGSLTAGLTGKVIEAWIIAATETLERTLRDSAGKRSYLPESFLIVDESLIRTERIIKGLDIHREVVDRNLRQYGPFAALELILAEAGTRGANRQEIHEVLREDAETSQEAVWQGKDNPLKGIVAKDERLLTYLTQDEINQMFDEVVTHIGDAPERALNLASSIKESISQ